MSRTYHTGQVLNSGPYCKCRKLDFALENDRQTSFSLYFICVWMFLLKITFFNLSVVFYVFFCLSLFLSFSKLISCARQGLAQPFLILQSGTEVSHLDFLCCKWSCRDFLFTFSYFCSLAYLDLTYMRRSFYLSHIHYSLAMIQCP